MLELPEFATVTLGCVHSAFISSIPSVNRATYLTGSTPKAANGRPLPPVPTPTSIRPRLSWSRVLMLLARRTGLCRVDTNTAQPSRSRSVQAAAYAIVSIGPSCEPGLSVPSCAQALSKPSSSARVR